MQILIFRYELAFEAVVPGLQSKRYLLEKGAKEYTATRKIDLAKSGNIILFGQILHIITVKCTTTTTCPKAHLST